MKFNKLKGNAQAWLTFGHFIYVFMALTALFIRCYKY